MPFASPGQGEVVIVARRKLLTVDVACWREGLVLAWRERKSYPSGQSRECPRIISSSGRRWNASEKRITSARFMSESELWRNLVGSYTDLSA